MQLLKNITLATLLSFSGLSAHSLWVNSFESFHHKPGHTTVGLGWGHTLPIDDTLNSSNGKVNIEEFSIITPNKEKTLLNIPQMKEAKPTKTAKDFEVFDAQIALQKIALNKDSTKGTYLIQAKTKPTFYTKYIDTKDRQRLKLKSKDKLKNIKEVLFSVKYQALASSYLSIGKWEKQKATATGLEIIPLSDLSNVKVGDLVEFEVLFFGKPLNFTPKTPAYITAHSDTFGLDKGFMLASYVKNGIAQFEVQSKGQWMLSSSFQEKVRKKGPLKDLYGKVNSVVYASTLTFNVK